MYDKPKKVAFFCVPMNTDMSELLLQLFRELQEEFSLANKYCSHMTLLFKPSGLNKENFLSKLGEEISLKPLYVLAKKGQGVTVVFDIQDQEGLYQGESLPHCTIGTGAGYPPNISNQIIRDWIDGNKDSIECIQVDMPEVKGIVSAAVHSKGGHSYVSRRDWVC